MMFPAVVIKNIYEDPPVILYLMFDKKSSREMAKQTTPTTLLSLTTGIQQDTTSPEYKYNIIIDNL